MVKIRQAPLAARIGTGIGVGINEQLPKELDYQRKTQGLKKFSEESGNQTPMQNLANIASVYGVTPQEIQSFSDLANQQARGQALIQSAKQGKYNPNQITGAQGNNPQQEVYNALSPQQTGQLSASEKAPSVTTREGVEAQLESYIPPTFQEIRNRAAQNFQQNPGLYGNDPQRALNEAVQEAQQEQSVNAAKQTRGANERDVQERIKSSLKGQKTALAANNVPAREYQAIEDKAINAIKSVKDGGEGLTEHEAAKKYGKELDKISEQYSSIKSVGSLGMLARSPSENRKVLTLNRQEFKKRDMQDELANTYIGENNVSPETGYYLAYDIKDNKELNNFYSRLPSRNYNKNYGESLKNPLKQVDAWKELAKFKPPTEQETKSLNEDLFKLMGKSDSPLAIAKLLRFKGYDADSWKEYCLSRRNELTENQVKQFQKPSNFFSTMSDNWLFTIGDIPEYQEIK